MPTYFGRISENKLRFTRPDKFIKWSSRNTGLWFKAKLDILGKDKDKKTSQELGYYYGLLLPEITNELVAQGHTLPMNAFGLEYDIPFNQDATHELLTALCGRVGDNGNPLRLSEMDRLQTAKFLDNVLSFACSNLGMNSYKLLARKPKT
jgi:hypothetical protein